MKPIMPILTAFSALGFADSILADSCDAANRLMAFEVTPTGGKAVMVNAGWRFHVDSSGQGELESTGGLTSFESDINALQIQAYNLARQRNGEKKWV